MQSLTPPQLAGVVCAMLTSENISKPQVWVAYEPSAAVIAAVTALEADREALYKAQVQHGVQAPLAVDLRLAGMGCYNVHTHLFSIQHITPQASQIVRAGSCVAPKNRTAYLLSKCCWSCVTVMIDVPISWTSSASSCIQS